MSLPDENDTAAHALLQQWSAAFEAADAPAIAALYTTDTVMFGTTTAQALHGRSAVQAYFEAAFAALGHRRVALAQVAVQALSADALAVSALDALHAVPQGDARWGDALQGRLSLVLRRGTQGWQIAQFHRSARPLGT